MSRHHKYTVLIRLSRNGSNNLLKNIDIVLSRDKIVEKVWGYDNAPDASNLSSFIRKLRLKIEPHPDNPRYIITVWGVGYKFEIQ